ncbi:nuclear transport factor 2 family protein [Streptomyces sp. NPDC088194]|uniref:nuclear transport factor 2 family protein n=1 Tax=Streptomyces sp. NPDC088194 TaxID=3154931 RepID=UPI00344B28A1
MPTRTPRETVEGFLAATIGEDPGALADFYAPHVVIEMPFAPPELYPARTETTREELRSRFRAGAAVRRYETVRDVRLHETGDPELVVAEYTLDGRLLAGDAPFTLSFAMFLTIRDGHILHSRDYADPLAGAKALGRLPELLTALGAPAPGPDPTTASPAGVVSGEDRIAVTDLLALHGHLTDAGELDRLDEVFSSDVVYDLTGLTPARGTLHGLDALVDAAHALGPANPVGHHVTNTVVRAGEHADRAYARSKGIGVMADGTSGSVTYDDTLVRGPRGWRVTHRRITSR